MDKKFDGKSYYFYKSYGSELVAVNVAKNLERQCTVKTKVIVTPDLAWEVWIDKPPKEVNMDKTYSLEKGDFNPMIVMGPAAFLIMVMYIFSPSAVCAHQCLDCGTAWNSAKYYWGWKPPIDVCPACGSTNITPIVFGE